MQIAEVPLTIVWQMRKNVMYPHHTLEQVQLKNDADGTHLGIWDNDICLSVISLFVENGTMQFRKFATLIAYQNQGIGTKLLQHSFNWALNNNCTKIWCNARLTALPFYKKFGMEAIGETWFENGHTFVKMVKTI
jgi:phosphoribosylformimino-5-aminoimidazole carboxamide ribotide isomerase